VGNAIIPGIEAKYQPRPPAPVRRCFYCEIPFDHTVTASVAIPIPSPSRTGCIQKVGHIECDDLEEEIGLF